MWAIIGLGNPGRRYARTRHNAGFCFIQVLARRWGVRLKAGKFWASIAEVKRDEGRLILAQPQTYMNLSGAAVRAIMKGYRIGPDNIVVVYDDLDIPLGQIRVRKEGSAGTHNGMRSVVGVLGSGAFARIRVGIGPLPEKEEATRFVLQPFAEEEGRIFKKGLAKAAGALDMIIAGRIDQAMNEFNKKERGPAGREEGPA